MGVGMMNELQVMSWVSLKRGYEGTLEALPSLCGVSIAVHAVIWGKENLCLM